TVSTGRTPASLIEPLRNINIKLPVIAMNGAVLYDIQKNVYIHAYIISDYVAEGLCKLLDGLGVNYFVNMLIDNVLMIQYKELKNDAEKDIFKTLSESPYRNYTTRNIMHECKCIYFMIVQEKEICKKIYDLLVKDEIGSHVKIMMYDSVDYKGYSYIKIYDRNASRESMLDYLKQDTGLTKTITFGSIEGKYDVVIDKFDNNKVAHTLKKMYEPPVWKHLSSK
ncbi:MAG: HAD family hydrolase, partial [Coprococcus sp.]